MIYTGNNRVAMKFSVRRRRKSVHALTTYVLSQEGAEKIEMHSVLVKAIFLKLGLSCINPPP